MKFVIPWVPPSNNEIQRMHWTDQRRLVQTSAAWILCAVPKPEVREFRRVRVRITMHRKRALDPDNAHGAVKPLLDAMVRLGFLADDAVRWLELDVPPVVIERGAPWTEIEMERLSVGAPTFEVKEEIGQK
jgi:hypothetical protein